MDPSRPSQTSRSSITTASPTLTAWLVPVVALCLYFALGASNLRLPGLYYDEALDAVPAVEFLTGQPLSTFSSVALFGREFPLMLMHHIGPTAIYASLAGFAALGVSVEALRLTMLAVGALALVLLWFLGRAWFGREVAAVAVLLCATAPAYVFWNRHGANWSSALLPLALGMLLALTRWRRSGRERWLILAAFLFGLGFTTKILFAWLLAPLLVTALLALGPRGLWHAAASLRPATCAAAALALAFGLLPFIAHNVPTGRTFAWIASNATRTSLYGHDNLAFGSNLAFVAREFAQMMGGDLIAISAPSGLPLGALAFALSLALQVMWLTRRAVRGEWRSPGGAATARLFLVLCFALVLPISTVSTTTIGAKYVFVLVPLAWLLIAISLVDIARGVAARVGRGRVGNPRVTSLAAGLLGGLAGLLALNHIAMGVAVHRSLVESGGRGVWSEAIYPLTEALERDFAGRPVIALDWGFRRSIEFLTLGRVQPREMFEYAPEQSAQFQDLCGLTLRDSANVYLVHAARATAFSGPWELCNRAAHLARKRFAPWAEFAERDGLPNAAIYTIEDVPRAFEAAPGAATRNADFATGLRLLGGTVAYDAARREIAIDLTWQALADALPDDTVLVHVIDPKSGQAVTIGDRQPLAGAYPFSQWQRGEVVVDRHWLRLPDGVEPGEYQVRIGAYDAATQVRRAIADPRNDAGGDSLMLQTFVVLP